MAKKESKSQNKGVTTKGTNSDDILIGTPGDDKLIGKKGDDILDGAAGNDKLNGNSGSDVLVGGSGDDKLNGNKGDDTLDGGSGDDKLNGNSGDDVLVGGAGIDKLNGNSGDDILVGGGGDDRIKGGSGNDTLDGGGGNDNVKAGSGDDLAIYVPSENAGATDAYDGGSGIDTLLLELTRDEWFQLDIQTDIQNFLAFVAAHTDPETGEADGEKFHFSAFDLTVRKFENLRVTVDGVELDPRDDAVTANDDSVTTATEESTVSGNVLDNDDVPDLVRSVDLVESPVQGTLVLDSNGAYTYDPGTEFDWLAEGETATETFTYKVTDADLDTDTATVTITITGTNDGPVAVADSGTTDENASITIDVLANDTDVDLSDTHTVDSASVAAGQGAVAIVANQVEWTPGTDFDYLAVGESATVVVDYTMSDNHDVESSSTLTLTVTGSNDGPVANVDVDTADENASIRVDVLANDTDFDLSDTHTVDAVSVPAGQGTVAIVGNQIEWTPGGDFDYLAVGETATVVVDYAMSDNHDAESSSTLTLTVTGSNDGPVAVADTDTTDENASITVDVLANDTDLDLSDTHSVDTVSVPAGQGTVAIVANQVEWTPGTDFDYLAVGETATVVVDYTMSDNHSASSSSTLTLTVTGSNDQPVVTDVFHGLGETDGVQTFNGQLSESDADVTDAHTFAQVANTLEVALPAGVTLESAVSATVAPDGSYSVVGDFDALAVGEMATVTFQYTATDDSGAANAESTAKTVTLTVTGSNDGPVAVDDPSGGQGLPTEPTLIGGEFQVNTYTSNYQTQPSTTMLNDGGYVVTWHSGHQDGSDYGVYGQRYDNAGSEVGGEFLINTFTDNEQSRPSVAALADGSFVVTWQSWLQDGSSYGVYGQRFDASGSPAGNEFQVNTFVVGGQFDPSVAALSDGGFVVTWAGQGQDGTGIIGQRYDASGNPDGGEFLVNTISAWQKTDPVVVANGDGFVVTWTSLNQDGGGKGIFGQRFDATGTKAGAEFQINTYTAGGQQLQSITELSGGGFVVTWHSNQQDGDGWGIFGQRFDASGNAAGGEFLVNSTTTNHQADPSVAALSGGGFVVAWTSEYSGIYGQAYDANGVALGGEFQVSTYAASNKGFVSVTGLDNDEFLVTWASFGQDGSQEGVFAQRLSVSASPSLATNEDTAIVIPTADLLANDTDVDSNDTHTVDSVSVAAGQGTVAIVGNQVVWTPGTDFDYLAVGESATVVVDYTMSDNHDASASSTLTLTITGSNDGPIADVDSGTTDENVSITVDVLSNDTDLDLSDTHTVDLASVPAGQGTVAIVANQIEWTPGTDFDYLAVGESATVVVDYTMSDNHDAESSSTLTLTVTGSNDGPVAVADTGTTDDNVVLSVDVLANDTDVDNGDDPSTFSLDTATISSGGGSVDIIAGQIQFDPGTDFDHLSLGQTEQVSIDYSMSDDSGISDSSTLTVTVIGTNTTPVAVADTISGDEDTVITGNVIANDTDADGDVLSVVNAGTFTTATGATVVLDANGDFTYTPVENFHGSDSFGYTITDGNETSSATANITVNSVNDGPIAVDDGQGGVTQTQTVDFEALDTSSGGVSGTALDSYFDGYGISLTNVIQPLNTVVVNSNNISQSSLASSGQNFMEQASGGYTWREYTLTFDADLDSFAFTRVPYYGATSSGIIYAEWSATAKDANGNVLGVFGEGVNGAYNPITNPVPAQTFSFDMGNIASVTFFGDHKGYAGTASAAIDDLVLTGLTGSEFSTDEDVALTVMAVDLLENDTDADGDTLSISDVGNATGGSVALDGNGDVVFTPDANFNGDASFEYTASDGNGGTATATVAVTVTAVNDAPEAGADVYNGTEDTPIVGNILANDTDDDGDALSVTNAGTFATAGGGTVTLAANGDFTYTPIANFNGADSFDYVLSDGTETVTSTVDLNLDAVNDGPTITVPELSGSEVKIAVTYDSYTTGTQWTVNQLNDSTAFNFQATAVHYSNADSLAELSNYDVVVHSGSYYNYMSGAYWAALRQYVEGDDGGVVTTGLHGYNMQYYLSGQSRVDADVVSPVAYGTINGYAHGYEYPPVTLTFDTSHPISDEVTSATVSNWSYYSAKLLDADAVSLGTNPGYAGGYPQYYQGHTAAYSEIAGMGNRAYVGGHFSETWDNGAMRSGAFDQLLEQATDWAAEKSGGTQEDTALTITGISVSDTDAGSDPILVSLGVENGALALNVTAGLTLTDADGSDGTLSFTGAQAAINAALADGLVYAPDANFNGSDGLTITVDDLGHNGSGGNQVSSASVEISVSAVNDAPVALGETVITDEDTPITINVLANDSDIDGDTLSIESFANMVGGTASLDGGGNVVFTPDANFNGDASFDYAVSDGFGGTDTATVNVDVNAINDAPVISVPESDFALRMNGNDSVLSGVITDSAVELASQSFSWEFWGNRNTANRPSMAITQHTDTGNYPTNQALHIGYRDVGDGGGDFTFAFFANDLNYFDPGGYAADLNQWVHWSGSYDAVTGARNLYKNGNLVAQDNAGIATYQGQGAITVGDWPTGGTSGFDGMLDGVRMWDGVRSQSEFQASMNGQVGDFSSALFAYDFNEGEGTVTSDMSPNGNDSSLTSSSFELRSGVTIATDEDAPLTINGITISDIDASEVLVTLNVSHGLVSLSDISGLSSVSGDGTSSVTLRGSLAEVNQAVQGLVYTPDANFYGTDTLSVTADDFGGSGAGGNLSDTNAFDIIVRSVNDAPTANADTFAGVEDNSITGNVLVNDSDLEGDALTVANAGTFATVGGGSVTLAANGEFTYTPATNFNGADQFDYVVSDGADTATSTVTLDVTAVNDGPTITIPALSGGEIRVAVTYGSRGSDGVTRIVSQLNDDSHFDFNATAIYYANADSLAELSNYDVVVHAGRYYDTMSSQYWAALRQYVEAAEGGVVTTGLHTYTTTYSLGGTSKADADFVSPSAANGYSYYRSALPLTQHEITDGISDLNSYSQDYYGARATDAGTTVLGSYGGGISVAYAEDANLGNRVYLGGNYSEAWAGDHLYRSGNFDQLLEQATSWAADKASGVKEDTPLTITGITVTDVDSGSDPIQATITVGHGVLSLNSVTGLSFTDYDGTDGSLTFSGSQAAINAALSSGLVYGPEANFNGIDTLTVTVDDLGHNGSGGAQVSTASVKITVSAVNDAPVALGESVTTDEDTPITINILGNDSDADGDALSVGSFSNVSGGSVTLDANSNAVFTPNADYSGDAGFDYLVSDGNGGSDTASVSIDVTPVVDAPTVSASDVTARGGSSGEVIITGGAEFGVNSTTVNNQQLSNVITLEDGGFVITWQSMGQDGSSWGVFGQRYDAAGNTLGNEFQVNTHTADYQQVASGTALHDGGFVITWFSNNQDGSQAGVYGQRYDSDGNTTGGEFQINTYTDQWQNQPSIETLNNGDFIVTWHSNFQDGSFSGVFAQRFDATANKIGGEFQINQVTYEDQTDPDISALADGGYIVTWRSYQQDGSQGGIFARRYDANDNPVGNEFQVNTHTNSEQGATTVSALSEGGFVITWSSAYQDGSDYGIYAQQFDANGNAVGSEFLVNAAFTAGTQIISDVEGLADGGFVISWQSWMQDGSKAALMARRYDADGNLVGDEFLVNDFTYGDQARPSIAARDDGGFVITWTDFDGHDGSGQGIFAKVYEGSGGSGQVTASLNLSAALMDTDGSESLVSIVLSGVPSSATLSAGTDNGNGNWALSSQDLAGLKITMADGSDGDYTMSLTATSRENATGETATSTAEFTLSVSGTAAVSNSPTYAAASFHGGSGDQLATEIDIYGGAAYLSGSDWTSGQQSLAIKYDLAAIESPTWDVGWPGAGGSTWNGSETFAGVTASAEGVFFAGQSYRQTTDAGGGKEVKQILVSMPEDGATGGDVGGAEWVARPQTNGYQSMFAYKGHEALTDVTTSEENGTSYLYAAGGGQPASYYAYTISKFDVAGNMIAAATDSSVGIAFNSYYRPSTGGSSAENVMVDGGKVWVAGSSGWAFEDATARPTLWLYDQNLSLTARIKDVSLTGTFISTATDGQDIFAVGHTYVHGVGGTEDYLIQKFDGDGNRLWSHEFGGDGTQVLRDVVTVDGHLFATGYTNSEGAGGYDSVLMEFDAATGDLLSKTLYGGTLDDKGMGISTDGNSLYIAGDSKSFASVDGNQVGQNDAMLLQYDMPTGAVAAADAPIEKFIEIGTDYSDVLAGGSGDDRIEGRGGDDILSGGLGNDQFVFGSNTGNDTVTDFDLIDDALVLQDGIAAAGTSEQDVNGDGTLDIILAFDDGGSVTLLGVSGLTDPDDLFV